MPRLLEFFITAIFCTFFFFSNLAVSQSHSSNSEVARLYSLEGKAFQKKVSTSKWLPIKSGAVFRGGDSIKVAKNSRAGILFADGMLVRLSENALVTFDSPSDLSLNDGKAHFFSRKPRRQPKIKTPMVNAAIFGTEFVIQVASDRTEVSIIDGEVECENKLGHVRAFAGELVTSLKNQAPTKQLLLKPFNSVQWAVSVPVLLEARLFDPAFIGASKSDQDYWQRVQSGKLEKLQSDSSLRQLASAFYLGKVGDFQQALELLEGQGSVYAQLLKLQLQLKSGSQNTSDTSKLKPRLKAKPQLMAAIIGAEAVQAFAANDFEKAKDLVVKVKELDKNSLNIGYLDSLLSQVEFDLTKATEIIKHLIQRFPNEASLYVRLAELYLAQDLPNIAKQQLVKAKSLSTKLARVHTIEGFIALAERNTTIARSAFDKALKLNSSSAEAYLGLALVQVTTGELESSLELFKKAAHLEPQQAVYRSYLGKAFFEANTVNLADQEYDLAVKLDPEDPTAYLYRAYSSLSQNKLVDALVDVEKSIEHNDSRAIYRSRLLLDQDLAVRSTSLGRLFNELGFSEVARLEAVKSISSDYLNYSAHRLLADTLTSIQDSDSSLSERRIANILSPVSYNLFHSSGERASSNEYSSLFDRSEQGAALFLGGESNSDIYTAELLKAGKHEDLGYVLAYDTTYANGRKNEDYLRSNRFRTGLQYQLDTDHKLLFDGSYQYFENHADLNTPIDLDTQAITGSLGHLWNISNQSTLILEAKYNLDASDTEDEDFRDVVVTTTSEALGSISMADELFIDSATDEETQGVSGSAQYIYQVDTLTSILGAQYLSIDTDRKESFIIEADQQAIFNDLERAYLVEARNDLRAYDSYWFNTLRPFNWLAFDFGLAYNRVEYEDSEVVPFTDSTKSKNRWNPKFGVHVYPWENLSLRAAYYESLRKSVLEDQLSIEPVSIGGFTQRFNDVSGSQARTMAFGLDYKIPGKSYFGLEYMDRRLVNPLTTVVPEFSFDFEEFNFGLSSIDTDFENHVEQDFAKAWWYQVVSDRVVLTTDYNYYRNDFTDPDLAQDIQSHKTKLSARYFMPGGFFTYVKSTWRQQDRTGSFFFDDGVEDFWLHDLGVGYRLPKRKGSIRLELNNIFDTNFEYDQFLGFEEFVTPDLSGRLLLQFNF